MSTKQIVLTMRIHEPTSQYVLEVQADEQPTELEFVDTDDSTKVLLRFGHHAELDKIKEIATELKPVLEKLVSPQSPSGWSDPPMSEWRRVQRDLARESLDRR